MFKWCIYCQTFIGETSPFEDSAISHGICANCEPRPSWMEGDLVQARFLRDIYGRLYRAGHRNDRSNAKTIVEEAIAAGCQPVDIVIGIVAPMLYEVGRGWEAGTLTVEDEQRFTDFCGWAFELVASKAMTNQAQTNDVPLLLINAPGNEHTLAIRFLAFWLQSRGLAALMLASDISFEDLLSTIEKTRSRSLLISISLPKQQTGVSRVAERLSTLPSEIRTRVFVGGYAVKVGLTRSIPGAVLSREINEPYPTLIRS
jgi:methanogenic corrinoid protein MtbC1